jgi:3-methyladenine DNA glycosylase/8-oxoguanine DNA glycosylase
VLSLDIDGTGFPMLASCVPGAARAGGAGQDRRRVRPKLQCLQALACLRAIHGIGPFGAELVLVRGAGAPDVSPAASWQPYRSWAALLLRRWWEDHHR